MLGGRCSLPRLLCRPYHRSCAPHLPPPPSSSFSSSLGSLSPRFVSSSAIPDAAASKSAGGSSGVKKTALGRRVVHVVLLSLTGGFALSALNDLAIFHGCSRKAIEKASQNQEFTDALGEPIVRGPWHAASLAVGRRRETVSCKFPVSGSKGNAILKIKAVSTGDDRWFSFLRHDDWEILISEALLPDERGQPSRVILINNTPSSDAKSQDQMIFNQDNK